MRGFLSLLLVLLLTGCTLAPPAGSGNGNGGFWRCDPSGGLEERQACDR
ncbi:MAG: hypothetical protein ABI364_05755 [Caldimonas sp.]